MTEPLIEIRGMDEILQRMKQVPQKVQDAAEETMKASLDVLHENVPSYPPPPSGSRYVRTGTLGRSLGSSFSGGKSGGASIYEVKKLGGGFEGRFGTNLEYAEYVIGDGRQASVHSGRWWTMKTIADRSAEKIKRIWNLLADKLAAWIDRNA